MRRQHAPTVDETRVREPAAILLTQLYEALHWVISAGRGRSRIARRRAAAADLRE